MKKDSTASQIIIAVASLGIVGLLGWIGSTAVELRDRVIRTDDRTALIEKSLPNFITRDDFAQFKRDIEWIPSRGVMMPRYASTNGAN